MILYQPPQNWIAYNPYSIFDALTRAKAAIMSLTGIPYQKSWFDKLQELQLKREISGTSKIEGAEFTEKELEIALKENPQDLHTRSQRQAAAARKAYRWITQLEIDRPLSQELIRQVHFHIVKDADDDHCEPGKIRGDGQNVVFGNPNHRGATGGDECEKMFLALIEAWRTEYQKHDPLVQALALHYHFGAMHPFLDGNGRTARALEAFMLEKAGLKDSLFIAMSNYYYEEKNAYLSMLAQARANNHDLTPFLIFGLQGIEKQCNRLFSEIKKNVSKALYTNLMSDLFNRLKSERKRVIQDRQMRVLELLLEVETLTLTEVQAKTSKVYAMLTSPYKALVRDLNDLLRLKAINLKKLEHDYELSVNLDWPTTMTDVEFFKELRSLPKAKTQLVTFT